MAFDSGVLSEDFRSAVIVRLYKGKEEMTECKNLRGASLISVAGKICAGILVYRVLSMIGGLIDDEEVVFRAARGYVNQIFTLKQTDEKAYEKSVIFFGRGNSRRHMIGRRYGRC